MRRFRLLAGASVAALVVLSACGGGGGQPAATSAPPPPTAPAKPAASPAASRGQSVAGGQACRESRGGCFAQRQPGRGGRRAEANDQDGFG